MTTFFSVKNFDRYQHYKDRSPPWIKLYNDLLDDYAFGLLQDASKWHLLAIWLLASRSNNKIPYDPKWVAKRINATGAVDLGILAQSGFILIDQALRGVAQDASAPQAKCLSREREETEERREETEEKDILVDPGFDEFWKTYPRREGSNPKEPAKKLFRGAISKGAAIDEILIGAKKYADEITRNRTEPKFVAQAVTWLRQQRWQDYRNGAGDQRAPEAMWDPGL